jgi:UDP-xylose:glucoside alpha-1,3-xylosyltransferase
MLVDKLYVYECDWNYRPDHCMYGSNCNAADAHGAKVLHGCRRCFHNDKIPAFKAVYEIFDNVRNTITILISLLFVKIKKL